MFRSRSGLRVSERLLVSRLYGPRSIRFLPVFPLGECSRRVTFRKTLYQICSSSWEGYHNVLLVVDYDANGQPMGVEITAPVAVSLERLNSLLAELGEAPLPEQDYLPLRAA